MSFVQRLMFRDTFLFLFGAEKHINPSIESVVLSRYECLAHLKTVIVVNIIIKTACSFFCFNKIKMTFESA